MFDCYWLSVPVQLIAWKDSSPNDLLCVELDVKAYTLSLVVCSNTVVNMSVVRMLCAAVMEPANESVVDGIDPSLVDFHLRAVESDESL